MVPAEQLSIPERVALITRNLEEVIGADELPGLLEQGMTLQHYIGLEISGKLHLGTGLMVMQKVRDLQQAGVKCRILLADWHTWLNDKLGGDREKIRKIGMGYFQTGLRASLAAVGGDPNSLEFIFGSDFYHHNDRYWEAFVDVCKNTTLNRIVRSVSIMGRSEGESMDFAKLLYPPMQVVDVFMLNSHIAHGGMDQRKAHVIARDVANALTIAPMRDSKGKVIKPIAIHGHLLLGLSKPTEWPVDPERLRELRTQMKMSKSKPASAVFLNDTPDEIRKKIRKAFCPPANEGMDFNPILDWTEHLIFNNRPDGLFIERKPENGGNIHFTSMESLKAAYADGSLHVMDLKSGLAEGLITLLEPVRKIFAEHAEMMAELESLL